MEEATNVKKAFCHFLSGAQRTRCLEPVLLGQSGAQTVAGVADKNSQKGSWPAPKYTVKISIWSIPKYYSPAGEQLYMKILCQNKILHPFFLQFFLPPPSLPQFTSLSLVSLDIKADSELGSRRVQAKTCKCLHPSAY